MESSVHSFSSSKNLLKSPTNSQLRLLSFILFYFIKFYLRVHNHFRPWAVVSVGNIFIYRLSTSKNKNSNFTPYGAIQAGWFNKVQGEPTN